MYSMCTIFVTAETDTCIACKHCKTRCCDACPCRCGLKSGWLRICNLQNLIHLW